MADGLMNYRDGAVAPPAGRLIALGCEVREMRRRCDHYLIRSGQRSGRFEASFLCLLSLRQAKESDGAAPHRRQRSQATSEYQGRPNSREYRRPIARRSRQKNLYSRLAIARRPSSPPPAEEPCPPSAVCEPCVAPNNRVIHRIQPARVRTLLLAIGDRHRHRIIPAFGPRPRPRVRHRKRAARILMQEIPIPIAPGFIDERHGVHRIDAAKPLAFGSDGSATRYCTPVGIPTRARKASTAGHHTCTPSRSPTSRCASFL